MIRFEPELTKPARRRRLTVALLSLLGSACVVALALWSGEISRLDWFEHQRSSNDQQVAPPALPAGGSVITAATNEQSSPDVRRLRLFGTTPGKNVREGTAQIGADNVPQTIAAGGMLENGAILEEVHADHVVLERDGIQAELYVDGVATNAKTAAKVNNGGALTIVEQPANALITPSAPSLPATYTNLVRAAPHYEQAEIVGFEVFPGTDRSAFDRLGFRAGDLLVNVDGVTISSSAALDAVLKNVTEGRAVTATVLRAGQEVTLAVEHTDAPPPAAALAISESH